MMMWIVAMRTNDVTSPFFPTFKGVRQGDPFSPLLFNLVADGFANMIRKAQLEGMIRGLVPILLKIG